MKGTKARGARPLGGAEGRACVRFDYSGHGESGGDFTDGTIGRWLEESVAVYRAICARARRWWSARRWAAGWRCCWRERLRKRKGAAPIAGMVLIAPAVDFTEELMWKQFSDAIKREIEEKGVWMRPSEYSRRALSDHQAA